MGYKTFACILALTVALNQFSAGPVVQKQPAADKKKPLITASKLTQLMPDFMSADKTKRIEDLFEALKATNKLAMELKAKQGEWHQKQKVNIQRMANSEENGDETAINLEDTSIVEQLGSVLQQFEHRSLAVRNQLTDSIAEAQIELKNAKVDEDEKNLEIYQMLKRKLFKYEAELFLAVKSAHGPIQQQIVKAQKKLQDFFKFKAIGQNKIVIGCGVLSLLFLVFAGVIVFIAKRRQSTGYVGGGYGNNPSSNESKGSKGRRSSRKR